MPGKAMQRVLLWGLLALLGVVSLACFSSAGRVPGMGTGSYPVEIFSEMHYQQSYRSQEPPRLAPPEGSVPRATPAPRGTAASLFASNCALCHGSRGRGDGPVLQAMQSKYNYAPVLDPDLTSAAVRGISDEDLRRIIAGGVVVMPSFGNLLTPEEQALVVEYIRALQ